MKILITAGFFGAGKTRFIKNLVKNTSAPAAVLVNEEGKTDIDGRELSAAGGNGLTVAEYTEGCICCSRKAAFGKALESLSGSNAEYLFIEASGAGLPGRLLDKTRKALRENMRLLAPVTVVSPRGFLSLREKYAGICEAQIREASFVVISDEEDCPAETLSALRKELRRIDPSVRILDPPGTAKGKEWLEALPVWDPPEESRRRKAPGASAPECLPVTSPARSYEELTAMLKDCLLGTAGEILRIKGIVDCCGKRFRLDAANGTGGITRCRERDAVAECLFIGRNMDREVILRAFVPETAPQKRITLISSYKNSLRRPYVIAPTLEELGKGGGR